LFTLTPTPAIYTLSLHDALPIYVEGVLDGAAVGQGVPDGGVPGDSFGQGQPVGWCALFEEFLDAFVDVPEAGFEFEDGFADDGRSEEHTSELQSRFDLVCRLLLE